MKALLCAVVLALLPSGAFAMSGREYLDHCARMTVYDRAQCMGYLDAILRRDTGTDFRNDQRRDDDLVEVAKTMRPTAYCLQTSVDLPLMRYVVEIGRASGREGGLKYVYISVAAVIIKKNK